MSKQVTTTRLTRQEKAWQIYEAGLVMKQTDDIYWVQSQEDPEQGYQVVFPIKKCECLYFLRTNDICKHWMAVQIVKLQEMKKVWHEMQVKALSKVGEVIQCKQES